MPTCPTCNYASPSGAKFCRQCGAPLLAESELSGAATRNYGRQEAGPALSAPLPPSIAEVLSADTERYARPVVAPPVYAPPSISTAPIPTRTAQTKWRWWLSLAGVLLLGFVLGAAFISANQEDAPPTPSPAELAALTAEQRKNDLQNSINDELQRQREQANEALQRRLEALQQAAEQAQQLSENAEGIAAGGAKALDLVPYEYPNAITANIFRLAGREMMTLRTTDSFDKIKQFYQAKLGPPIIEMNGEDSRRLVFQTDKAPYFSVLIETDDEDDERFKITVQRTPGAVSN